MSTGTRAWGWMLALAIATPSTASAAAPVPVPEPSEDSSVDADDPALALSRAHFKSGLVAYQSGNYARAVTQWTQAHALMASVPALAGPRQVLGLDLGQAHLRAYDADGDATHLRSARPLLQSYVTWVDRPDHALTEIEREDRPRALEMLARIDALTVPPVPEPRVGRTQGSADAPRPPLASAKTSRGLVVAGAASLGVSVISAVTALAMIPVARRAERDFSDLTFGDPGAERRGIRANQTAIAMGSISVVTLLVGAPLLACGLVARQRNLSAAPTLSRGYVGARLGLRF